MQGQPSQTRAIIDLFAAHKELSSLEWLEFVQSMTRAGVWLGIAILSLFVGWLGINALLIFVLRGDPTMVLGAIAIFNLLIAALGALQARRVLNRPFFALTKREAARDVKTLLEGLS